MSKAYSFPFSVIYTMILIQASLPPIITSPGNFTRYISFEEK